MCSLAQGHPHRNSSTKLINGRGDCACALTSESKLKASASADSTVKLLKEANSKTQALRTELTDVTQKLSEKGYVIDSLQAKIKARDEEILRLCRLLGGGRPVSALMEEHGVAKASQIQMFCTCQKDCKYAGLEHANLKLEKKLKACLRRQHDAMTHALRLAERNKLLESRLNSKEDKEECKTNHKDMVELQERITSLTKLIEDLKRENRTNQSQVKTMRSKTTTVSSKEKEHSELREKLEDFKIMEKDLMKETDRLERENLLQKSYIADLETKLLACLSSKEELERASKLYSHTSETNDCSKKSETQGAQVTSTTCNTFLNFPNKKSSSEQNQMMEHQSFEQSEDDSSEESKEYHKGIRKAELRSERNKTFLESRQEFRENHRLSILKQVAVGQSDVSLKTCLRRCHGEPDLIYHRSMFESNPSTNEVHGNPMKSYEQGTDINEVTKKTIKSRSKRTQNKHQFGSNSLDSNKNENVIYNDEAFCTDDRYKNEFRKTPQDLSPRRDGTRNVDKHYDRLDRECESTIPNVNESLKFGSKSNVLPVDKPFIKEKGEDLLSQVQKRLNSVWRFLGKENSRAHNMREFSDRTTSMYDLLRRSDKQVQTEAAVTERVVKYNPSQSLQKSSSPAHKTSTQPEDRKSAKPTDNCTHVKTQNRTNPVVQKKSTRSPENPSIKLFSAWKKPKKPNSHFVQKTPLVALKRRMCIENNTKENVRNDNEKKTLVNSTHPTGLKQSAKTSEGKNIKGKPELVSKPTRSSKNGDNKQTAFKKPDLHIVPEELDRDVLVDKNADEFNIINEVNDIASCTSDIDEVARQIDAIIQCKSRDTVWEAINHPPYDEFEPVKAPTEPNEIVLYEFRNDRFNRVFK